MTIDAIQHEVRQAEIAAHNALKDFRRERQRLYTEHYEPRNGDDAETREQEHRLRHTAQNALKAADHRLSEMLAEQEATLESCEQSPLSTLPAETLQQIEIKQRLFEQDGRHDYERFVRQARTALRSGDRSDRLAYLRAARAIVAGKRAAGASHEMRTLISELADAVVPAHVKDRRDAALARLEAIHKARLQVGKLHYQLKSDGGMQYQRSFEQVIRRQRERELATGPVQSRYARQ